MNTRRKNDDIVIIKKYANRRLYNTETSGYVTLEDLSKMVKAGREFEVVDAKTGNDITHQVLTQIIFDEETRGTTLLPTGFLRQLIKFYDHSMQSMVPHYLEMMMDVFTKNQSSLQENYEKTWGQLARGFSPMPGTQSLEEIQKANLEMLRKTFAMFNPFLAEGGKEKTSQDKTIDALSAQIERLNRELEELRKKHP